MHRPSRFALPLFAALTASFLAPALHAQQSAAPATPPATTRSTSRPATRPASYLEVRLPVRSSLPSSPGYFVLQASVSVGNFDFPMTFGVFLPASYFTSGDAKYPAVVMLHNKGVKGIGGGGLTGEGLASMLVRDGWETREMYARPERPTTQPIVLPTLPPNPPISLRKTAQFIGIVPQCPGRMSYENKPMPRVIAELVTQLEKVYRLDGDRVYLTGFSYGGTCTWEMAQQTPWRYAAIAPLSGRATGNPAGTAEILKDIPVYIAWGTSEWSMSYCQQMRDALLESKHPNLKWRQIEMGSHWCYPLVYTDAGFWEWLLSQRRHTPAAAGPAKQ